MLDLYEAFYKLSADPFRLSPDQRFVLDHPSYVKSKACLESAIRRGEGLVLITGGAGTGKTTLIHEILAQLSKTHIPVATLTGAQLESLDLLQMVGTSFGLSMRGVDKSSLLLELEEFLKLQGQKGRRAILIVDEAQGLSSSALEELGLLARLQYKNRWLLQTILVGQQPLGDVIATSGVEHLSSRIVATSQLEPLDLNETVTYVVHRLCKAGWQRDPNFDEDVFRLIHKFSSGIPRRINLICSRLILHGAMEEKHVLGGDDARIVIEGLQKEQLVPSE